MFKCWKIPIPLCVKQLQKWNFGSLRTFKNNFWYLIYILKSRCSFLYIFYKYAFYSIVCLINLSLRFLGHCVEFNLQGGVIQDQYASPCNDTFPKCDKYYNSSTAYKCNVIIYITLKHNSCHSCHDRRLINQTPGSGSDHTLKLKNLHFLNVSWLETLTKFKGY